MDKDLIRTYKLALIGVETYLSVKDVEIITKLYNIFSGLEIFVTPTPKNVSIEYCRRILDDNNRTTEFKTVFAFFYLSITSNASPYIRIVENLEDDLKDDFFITEILSDIYSYKQKPHKILYHDLSHKITLEGQKHLKNTLKQLGIDRKGFNTDV